MRAKQAEIFCGIICIVLAACLAMYITASPWHTPGADIMDHNSFFPLTACAMLAILGAWQCLWAMRLPASEIFVRLNMRGLFLLALWTLFGFLLPVLGFLAGGVIFLCLSMFIWGERRIPLLLTVGTGLPLAIYIVLGKLLHVSYPQGIIPF